ncbi:MAG TPA: glycosyltransferase family 4 protein [Pyrinomonadaceae bacterium]|jgi:glycosyltransferase involved in cell wall biosynthesis|nr:glycosyltransferase family 4 protein [Pyrinomonadaceae bacterium]
MERTTKESGLHTWRGASARGAALREGADVPAAAARQERGADAARQKPIRLLVVAPSDEYLGGQSIHAAQLVRELRKEPDFRVGFASIAPRALGLAARVQRVRYARPIVRMPLYLANLLLKIPRHDVIHVSSAALSSFLLTTTPAILLAKLFGRRVVLNYHAGQAVEHLRDWARTAIPVIRMCDATVVPSLWLVDVFATHGLKARAIFNHVELDAFRFRERRPLRPVFLSNRNFDPIYNVPCVLRAFSVIQRRVPNARLIVAGDGPQRPEIEALARELDLKNVEFKGLLAPEAMPRVCDEADVYLNASNVDNMPLSILEAFSSGLAVVTTNAGGIPHMVGHGRTGLVVRMNDHEAIAASALRLLEDGDLAARLTSAARAECDKFRWDVVRPQWIEFYREVAEGR